MNNYQQFQGLPDWGTAPDWANYVAMDKNGKWYWFEFEPQKEGNCWNTNFKKGGMYSEVRFNGEKWETSLQKRPE